MFKNKPGHDIFTARGREGAQVTGRTDSGEPQRFRSTLRIAAGALKHASHQHEPQQPIPKPVFELVQGIEVGQAREDPQPIGESYFFIDLRSCARWAWCGYPGSERGRFGAAAEQPRKIHNVGQTCFKDNPAYFISIAFVELRPKHTQVFILYSIGSLALYILLVQYMLYRVR